MNSNRKRLSSPFSTGGGGVHFETNVQAAFVALMLTGGYAPCLPCWPIIEIKLQGRVDGFETDDLIVFVESSDTRERRRLLGQVKHSIQITRGNTDFSEVIRAAWCDFNNPKVFAKGKDRITLITGPLSATDTRNVKWLLSQARNTKGVDEYFRNVTQANFRPSKSEEKLEAIQYHLKTANDGRNVSRDDLHDFLNHFHLLGYDLGEEVGVVFSLLHSHISQLNRQVPQSVWSRIVDFVRTWNQNSGTVTAERIPEDLRDLLKQPAVTMIPEGLATTKPEPTKTDWSQHQHATDLALVNLVGAWSDTNEADAAVLAEILGIDYCAWVQKAREILHLPDSPLLLKNGQWNLIERADLWDLLGSRIFDRDLDTFKGLVVTVLTERNPSLELPAEVRFAAGLHGKELTHSHALRKGLAEGLAILGSNPGALVNCSRGKAEAAAVIAVREVFTSADWQLWGSLNSLLPTLAEAAPDEFLDAVERALQLSPCPFDGLFGQEGGGITGGNYLTGLLWALEALAWDEKHLVRACVILGELASHDPGGQWANRPGNSLTTILLPWFPQTIASIEKRKVAVQTLCNEWPDIGWDLLISLLPGQVQTSTRSYRPKWRKTIPDGWEESVSQEDYWRQVSFYAELAVLTADNDTARLTRLIDHLDNLPKPSFDMLLENLSSEAVSNLPEEQRLLVWEHLAKFTSRHRRFAGAKWAVGDELLSAIETVAAGLAPSDPLNLYRHLFSDRGLDLYEESGNWREQQEKLEERRQEAIKEILQAGGTDAVIRFAESVTSPWQVGHVLGWTADSAVDVALLPAYLNSENRNLSSLASGFVLGRYQVNEWEWVDGLDRSGWDDSQLGCFLSCLPFNEGSWDRASQWLGKSQGEYWSRTSVTACQADSHLDVAIDRLIEYGRPLAAIGCLARMRHIGQPINVSQCVRALMAALSSTEPTHAMGRYDIVEVIKHLQADPGVSPDDLFRVEWAYLPLLDHHQGAEPRLLETRLASDPEFFCEVIQLIYRSTKEGAPRQELSEQRKAMASNAWRLLHEWRTPPGMQEDGSFSEERFSGWLERVRGICAESGHLEIALENVGKVLIHSPSDRSGLWINSRVAEALNGRDAEDMRHGYMIGVFNSRGVHWVDPTGRPERELAELFRQKAEDVENDGFQRLAHALRSVAERYDRDAARIVYAHGGEGEDRG